MNVLCFFEYNNRIIIKKNIFLKTIYYYFFPSENYESFHDYVGNVQQYIKQEQAKILKKE